MLYLRCFTRFSVHLWSSYKSTNVRIFSGNNNEIFSKHLGVLRIFESTFIPNIEIWKTMALSQKYNSENHHSKAADYRYSIVQKLPEKIRWPALLLKKRMVLIIFIGLKVNLVNEE